MKRTILLGGSGFMGPHILSLDPSILSVGRSPPPSWVNNKHINVDPIANPEFLDTLEFDRVIFLIGNSNHHAINSGKINAFSFNVYPLKKFLSCIAGRGIRQFLAFSTILMYDQKKMALPVSEDQPINPYVNEYVFSKYVAEQICEYYRKFMPIINIRMSNVYGPIMLDRPDLVPTMIKSLLSKGTCEILSDKPVRDFIYVKDAASAFLKLLKTDFSGTVNMGTGEMHSVKEVCDILRKLSGSTIIVQGKPVEGHQKFCCNTSKLKSLISGKPKYSLEQGLRETYETMKKWMGK